MQQDHGPDDQRSFGSPFKILKCSPCGTVTSPITKPTRVYAQRMAVLRRAKTGGDLHVRPNRHPAPYETGATTLRGLMCIGSTASTQGQAHKGEQVGENMRPASILKLASAVLEKDDSHISSRPGEIARSLLPSRPVAQPPIRAA